MLLRATTHRPDEIRRLIQQVPNWYHRVEVAPGIVTPGV